MRGRRVRAREHLILAVVQAPPLWASVLQTLALVGRDVLWPRARFSGDLRLFLAQLELEGQLTALLTKLLTAADRDRPRIAAVQNLPYRTSNWQWYYYG